MDYCASVRNIDAAIANGNCKVRAPPPPSAVAGPARPSPVRMRAPPAARGAAMGRADARMRPTPAHRRRPPALRSASKPQLVKGDIQSMDLLTFVLGAEEIDTVMHFAAQVRMAGPNGTSKAGPHGGRMQRCMRARGPLHADQRWRARVGAAGVRAGPAGMRAA
jgi:hypothetical protein